MLRKSGNQTKIISKKGKTLGTYPTREAAAKRLRQIEYFKALNAGKAKKY